MTVTWVLVCTPGFPAPWPLASPRTTWNGEVPSRGMSTVVFAVTVTEEQVIYNTATINDGLGGLTERSALTKVHPHDVYLPLIVKDYGP